MEQSWAEEEVVEEVGDGEDGEEEVEERQGEEE